MDKLELKFVCKCQMFFICLDVFLCGYVPPDLELCFFCHSSSFISQKMATSFSFSLKVLDSQLAQRHLLVLWRRSSLAITTQRNPCISIIK